MHQELQDNNIMPLEKKTVPTIKDGKVENVSAFHKGWAEKCEYIPYYTHPDTNAEDELEEWMEMAEYVVEDLEWLIELPHHRFWSQMKYDRGVHQLLVSFLDCAPRFYDMNLPPENSEVKKIIDVIHHKIFIVYLRLSTFKESKENFISKDVFSDVIYNKYIFDIPKIMDLCVLYGRDNSKLLQKMISNIFSVQGSYFTDLHEASLTILDVLDKTSEKLGVIEGAEDNKPQSVVLKTATISELEDVTLFIVDTCATLYHFLEIFPKGYECFDHDVYRPRIVHFYEHTVLSLIQELNSRMKTEDSSLITKLLKRLSMSRANLVNMYHQLLYTSLIQPLYESTDVNINVLADKLLDEFTSLLSDRRFLLDYNEKFPIIDNLEVLKSDREALDLTRIEYITNGIIMIQADSGFSEESSLAQGFNNLSVNDEYSASDSSDSENYLEGATACPAIDGVELDSLITQIKDLLPDLGDGFVEACLDYYNYNPEMVINCLLEDSLPPVLQQLNRNEERKPKQEAPVAAAAAAAEPSILETRANIYDNDEFDVFNKSKVDLSRIHIGKKNNTQKELLDNKAELMAVNDIYSRYSNVDAVGDEENAMISLEYDDEYDDTYDSHLVGSTEPDADLDNDERPFTTPRILQQADKIKSKHELKEVYEEEDGDNFKPAAPNTNFDNFVQDPALLREKAEQRRQSQMQYRGRGGRGGRGGGGGRGSSNVQGKPKGQGQDADTVKNRANKDRSKAARGNHNRRILSQRKHARGMM